METQLFVKLEDEIRLLTQQEQNLATLASYVAGEAFDDEDRSTVRNKQMHIAATKRHLMEVLVKKKEIYHTQIKMMQARLDDRKTHLEDFSKNSSLFTDFPDVLDFFARKQSRLNETLSTIKDKLVG